MESCTIATQFDWTASRSSWTIWNVIIGPNGLWVAVQTRAPRIKIVEAFVPSEYWRDVFSRNSLDKEAFAFCTTSKLLALVEDKLTYTTLRINCILFSTETERIVHRFSFRKTPYSPKRFRNGQVLTSFSLDGKYLAMSVTGIAMMAWDISTRVCVEFQNPRDPQAPFDFYTSMALCSISAEERYIVAIRSNSLGLSPGRFEVRVPIDVWSITCRSSKSLLLHFRNEHIRRYDQTSLTGLEDGSFIIFICRDPLGLHSLEPFEQRKVPIEDYSGTFPVVLNKETHGIRVDFQRMRL